MAPGRNLILPGRILLPMCGDMAKATMAKWRKSPVFARSLLDEAELLSTKDMLMIEDLSECAPPATTDPTTHVNPPEKSQQIGVTAGQSILRGFFGGCGEEAERKAFLVIDLTPHTGDVMRGFLAERAHGAMPGPSYYMGFCVDSDHMDWLGGVGTQFLADGFLKVEGHDLPLPATSVLPPAEMPSEAMQATPPPPKLSMLVTNDKVKVDSIITAKVPDTVLKAWHDHDRFGSEFRQWLEKARAPENLIDVAPEKADGKGANDKKRTIGGLGGGSSKIARTVGKQVATSHALALASDWTPELVSVDDLPSPMLSEGALPGSGRGRPGAMVSLFVGQKIYLCNRTTAEQVVCPGTVLAGFYKGCWWHGDGQKKDQAKEVDPKKDILFTLMDSNDMVQIGSVLTTLGQTVAEKQKTSANVKVGYHTMKENPMPSDPAFFRLARNFSMYFQVGDVPVSVP